MILKDYEQPAPDFPLPHMPDQHPPKKTRHRRKLLVLALAITGFALVAAVSAYLWVNRPASSNASATRHFTYYYRDGKTVLWRGVEPFAADSPAIVHRVHDELADIFSQTTVQEDGDWKITTTLDQSLQDVAKQQVEAQREQLGRQRAEDAALMAQDVTTGQIVSWVVGFDDRIEYSDENRLSAQTQAGTLVLPLVYAAYIDSSGASAETVVEDVKKSLPGYECTSITNQCLENLDRRYLGQITLRQALGGLRLVPAVKAALSTSISKTISVIEAMMGPVPDYSCYESRRYADTYVPDFERETLCYAAAAIGDGAYAAPQDLLQAYATLSNDGTRLPQTSVLKVERDGKLFYKWEPPDGYQAVKADSSHAINDILSDPSVSYLTRKSVFAIGDTKVSTIVGFTNDSSVGSAVQYSPKYVVGFWAFGGQDQSEAIRGFIEMLALPPVAGWLAAALGGQE